MRRLAIALALAAAAQAAAFAADEPPSMSPEARPVPYDPRSFSPDPSYADKPYDIGEQLRIYGGKSAVPNPRPMLELGRPMYQGGPYNAPGHGLGRKNPTDQAFSIYGDWRTAMARNNNGAGPNNILATRLNLDVDWKLTATERVHAFFRPLDHNTEFTRCERNGSFEGTRCTAELDAKPETLFFEGDLGALTALSEDSVIVGKIKLAPDVRTNRIHVITRPINMPFIRKLIAELDANVEFGKPVTRPLRYISASDVLPVLVQALTEPGGEQQQGGAGGTAGPQAGPTPQRTPNPTVTNPYNVGQGSTASGSNLNVSEELSTQPVDTAPKAVTIGNSKIIADQRANTIIVLGSREVVVKIEKILDEMDVKAPQVALATVIGELTLNNDEQFGVDYFIRGNKKYALTTNFPNVPPPFPGGGTTSAAPSPGGTPITTGGSVFDPGNLISFTQLATNAAQGTNIYLAAGATLASVVHALDSTGRFRVISRPMVFTSNNKKAIIANGQEIPVPVNTLSNVSGATVAGVASVQSSIEFKKVALQLEVVPLINSEKEVSLDILQKIDSVVPGSNVNIGGNQVPTIATRYIRTNVSAPNCSTIVLGGLITDTKNTSKDGIPYLSRLPVVGSLFRSTTKNRDRTELIILMRPEVSLTKLDLYRLRQKHEDRTHFGPELEQEDCPDCPKRGDGKQLPPPDVPSAKDVGMR